MLLKLTGIQSRKPRLIAATLLRQTLRLSQAAQPMARDPSSPGPPSHQRWHNVPLRQISPGTSVFQRIRCCFENAMSIGQRRCRMRIQSRSNRSRRITGLGIGSGRGAALATDSGRHDRSYKALDAWIAPEKSAAQGPAAGYRMSLSVPADRLSLYFADCRPDRKRIVPRSDLKCPRHQILTSKGAKTLQTAVRAIPLPLMSNSSCMRDMHTLLDRQSRQRHPTFSLSNSSPSRWL